jgi:SPP1 gp7 family putative phage head morphogenesis protein
MPGERKWEEAPELTPRPPLAILGPYQADWPEEGPEQVAMLFSRRVPVTRAGWAGLVERSNAYAEAMAAHEQGNAINDMGDQSPDFRALSRGQLPPGALRPTDTFFATGVPVEKAGRLRDLIANVIAGESERTGTKIRELGLGNFILSAQHDLGLRLTDARLETVLRTNMASSQTEGERETLRNPVVRAFVPLVQWSATHDNRTRETHRAMDGYIGTVDDFERQRLGPPAGMNCRCAAIPVSVSRAIDAGFCDANGQLQRDAISAHNGARQKLIDSGQFPDKGFG